jgi:hypothetical protein
MEVEFEHRSASDAAGPAAARRPSPTGKGEPRLVRLRPIGRQTREVAMSETLNGSCLCGGIEYEVRDPKALAYCHCSRCQRWTGSSLAGVVVDKDNFTVTKGQDLVKRYESQLAPRHFCSNCGSSLYDDLGEVYFVAAGLMPDLDMRPAFHQQVAYKARWHEIGDDAPQYAEMPPA